MAAASVRCLRPFGRFVEIVDEGIEPHGRLGPQDASRNLACFAIDLTGFFSHGSRYYGAVLEEITELLQAGELAPLPFVALPVSRVAGAFPRLAAIAAGGSLILTLRHTAETATPEEIPARFSADASYLITGGLGGLGLYLAEWMIDCGARHLVLMSRRTPDREIEEQLQRFRDKGAQIYHSRADVTHPRDVDETLQHIATCMPPLRGVLHCASTLDDVVVALMKPEQLKSVMASKTQGAWNLHELTLAMPLDFFVLFSSGAALLGPPGSANYAAGNAFLDALAEYRRQLGLTALSVGWGLWGDAGMVTGSGQQRSRIKLSGFRTIPAAAGARILGQLLQTDIRTLAVMPVDWAQLRRAARATTSTPFLEEVFAQVADDPAADYSSTADIVLTLKSAEPARRGAILLEFLQRQLSVTLGTSPEKIQPDRPLSYLGVDSLLALELKNRVEAELRVSIRIADLLEGPTLQTLAAILLQQIERTFEHAESGFTPPVVERAMVARVGVGRSAQAVLERIDELEDDDLDALYKQMLAEKDNTP
jgi:NAD(P)-dependent dehydrogenase (short-subunit alcohol dehydrogenase family)/acyl carrier protein